MNGYLQFKKKIQQRLEILEETIQELEKSLGVKESAASWREQLGRAEASLHDPLLRIAVAGSVKSGKSTLINTLVGGELLKRGAGIITAFITRIRTEGEAGGWVELKSWPQVHDELNAAVRSLPVALEEASSLDLSLDLRSLEDRNRLASLLDRMQTEWLQTKGRIDSNFILIKAFLEGRGLLDGQIGENVQRLVLNGASLPNHQRYVGQESHAVYVRDVELHYPVPWLGENVEIADCQGADSPNPAHFELIQRHLLKSHFILYVINSRSGLREADFKLLDFIKALRMFPQTFFVLNVDIDSHTDREDLERLASRAREELAWIVPAPQLFAFSSLYHLAEQSGEKAPERERRRLELWREERELAEATEEGFASFKSRLVRRITDQRSRTLIGSGLSRLAMTAGSILDAAGARQRFLNEDAGSLAKATGQLENKEKALQGTLATLQNAIAGLRDSLLGEIDDATDSYFDLRTGLIVRETMEMAERYPVDQERLADLADRRQFLRQFYRFYLEFRQSLASYLVEKVNLKIIEFAKEQESLLHERFNQSARAFWSLFETAVLDYRKELARYKVRLQMPEDMANCRWPATDGAPPPSFSAFVDQEAVSRGTLLMKFGIGRFSRFLLHVKSQMGKGGIYPEGPSRGNDTLEEAVSLVKTETMAELAHAFRTYRKSFKQECVHRMLEEGILLLMREFGARIQATRLDFSSLRSRDDSREKGKEPIEEVLTRVSRITAAMVEELEGLRFAVNLEWPTDGDGASQEAEAPSG